MKIENNIIKHYLQNVYFITGTAYAGKSTAVRMLAEKYGMIHCGENYHYSHKGNKGYFKKVQFLFQQKSLLLFKMGTLLSIHI